MKVQNQKYSIVQKIGGGSYGCVYKAIDLKTSNQSIEFFYSLQKIDQFVAIKKLKIQNQEGCDSSQLREIANILRCKHPNIINLLNVDYEDGLDSNRYLLIFPFCPYDLHDYIKNKRLKDQVDTNTNQIDRKIFYKNIFHQILSGLSYLHQNGIIHRDLKPTNILVSQDNLYKIADFGITRSLRFTGQSEPITPDTVTLNYRAPEILIGSNNYTFSIDLWSLGCLFYEIITQKPLFLCNTQIGMLFEQFKLFGFPNEKNTPTLIKLPLFTLSKFPRFQKNTQPICEQLQPVIDQDGTELILDLLQLEPSMRLTCEQALKHKFFT